MTVYEHTVPTGLLVIAIILAVLAGAYSAWRFLPRNVGNIVLASLYLTVLAIVAWCLLLPGRKDAVTQLLKPRFVVALDTSRSMTLSPTGESTDRWTTAGQALKQPWTKVLGAECEIDVFPFSSRTGESVALGDVGALAPEGKATLLRDGLKLIADRYSGLNVAGGLLLSDGIDTREAFDDWAGDERPFPFHTVRLEEPGEWQKEPDLRIDAVTTARRVTVGWQTEFKVRVSGQGTQGAPVSVQVFSGENMIAEKPTQIANEGAERELLFELEHPQIGVYEYRAFIPPLPGEKNTEDNEYIVPVRVIDARNRLLYVEGAPRWDYKFLRRVLLAQQQITPIIFYTGPDGKPYGGTQAGNLNADMTSDQLALFKIVVVGNLNAEELTAQRADNLVTFVSNGGSLVLLGGRKAWAEDGIGQTGLSKILPIRGEAMKPVEGKDPMPVRLTDTARAHPAFAGDPEFWEIIPPVLSVFLGGSLAPGAQTLVNVETPQGQRPIVATQRYGQGKVTVILTDSLWRWQLGPEASKNQPYQRFWTQLLGWLLPEEEELEEDKIDVFAERDQLFLGEELEIHARIGGKNAPSVSKMECKVTGPDGREVPYRMASRQVMTPSGKSFPGFSFTFTATDPGLYKAVGTTKLGDAMKSSEPFSFFVRPYSPETMPRPINAKVLEAIATASGGQFFADLQSLDEGLSSLKLTATEESTAEFHTLWRHWIMVSLLMAMLAVSWGLRKFRNMP